MSSCSMRLRRWSRTASLRPAGLTEDFADELERAQQAIDSGAAQTKLHGVDRSYAVRWVTLLTEIAELGHAPSVRR